MDKQYKTGHTVFEWDTNKAEINKQKHGISFELATQAFTDSKALIAYDITHSEQEERYTLLGTVQGVVLVFVVFTENNTIRIISARKATRKEERHYAGTH